MPNTKYVPIAILNLVAALVLVLTGGQVMRVNAAPLNQTAISVGYDG
ncbi:MAG: hypothetical protein WCE25_11835 [Nitrososphaeraceae archaeon]